MRNNQVAIFFLLLAVFPLSAKNKQKITPTTFKSHFSAAAELSDIRTVCDTIAAWQFGHPDYPVGRDFTALDWTNAVFYRGVANWGSVSGNRRWRDLVRRAGKDTHWQLDVRPFHADDHCIGQVWLDLYLEDGEDAQLAATERGLRAFADKPIHSLSTADYDEEITWCDGLFMSPPTMAQLATITGDTMWFDRLESRWWNTTGYLFDARERLYFRDRNYFNRKEKNGEPIFWSRGNGWVLSGLVNVLREMPVEYIGRERLITLYKTLSERILSLQLADGSWHPSLLDPEAYPAPETSGTAFYAYAFLWGVNQGILPEQPYFDAAMKAWRRVVANIHPDGMQGCIQRPGTAPNVTTSESNANYGTGAVLLAGSELFNHVLLRNAAKAKLWAANKLKSSRLREVAALPWSEAVRKLPGLTASNVAVRDGQSGQFVPIQVLDADGDGNSDELLFLATLMPGQTKAYELLKMAGQLPPSLPSRLHARYVPERKEDFAWENDRMAFRLYGPSLAVEGNRGGVDVWCKRTREAIVDKWYKTGNYHEDHGEGCDGFKVGDGLGAGGTGYLDKNGKWVTSPVYASWKLLASGPLRLVFELTYTPLKVGEASIVEKRKITMNYGESLFKVEAEFQVSGDAAGIRPVAGIRSDKGIAPEKGRPLTQWCAMENIFDGFIGLGLLVDHPENFQMGWNHLYVPLAEDLSKPVHWYAGATWSGALDHATPISWHKCMRESSLRFKTPIETSLKE